MTYTSASVKARAKYLGRSTKEMVAAAGLTDKQTAQFLGLGVSAVADAPDLVLSPVDTPQKPTATLASGNITVTTATVATATTYKCRSRIDDGPWNEGAYQASPSWTFTSVADGSWEFEVRARNAGGTESEWSTTSDPVVVDSAPATQAAKKPRTRKAKSDE